MLPSRKEDSTSAEAHDQLSLSVQQSTESGTGPATTLCGHAGIISLHDYVKLLYESSGKWPPRLAIIPLFHKKLFIIHNYLRMAHPFAIHGVILVSSLSFQPRCLCYFRLALAAELLDQEKQPLNVALENRHAKGLNHPRFETRFSSG